MISTGVLAPAPGIVAVLVARVGASLTGVMRMVATAGAASACPSHALTVRLRVTVLSSAVV